MHYVTSKGILSASNGMNLYRGCTHGCIYCDSRSDCYHMNHAFEDIEVKQNALELLEDALKRKRKRCMIGTGAMTDPYIPLENDLRYVRKSLSLAEKYGFGFTLITKSTQVLRDLDILKKINEKTKCVVQMTLTTYDEQLCRKLEPLKGKYIAYYGNQYILPSPNENHLRKIFNQTCDKYHIVHDNDKVFEYLRTYEEKDKCEQLSLFDFIQMEFLIILICWTNVEIIMKQTFDDAKQNLKLDGWIAQICQHELDHWEGILI